VFNQGLADFGRESVHPFRASRHPAKLGCSGAALHPTLSTRLSHEPDGCLRGADPRRSW
jgi:hypothetical protein